MLLLSMLRSTRKHCRRATIVPTTMTTTDRIHLSSQQRIHGRVRSRTLQQQQQQQRFYYTTTISTTWIWKQYQTPSTKHCYCFIIDRPHRILFLRSTSSASGTVTDGIQDSFYDSNYDDSDHHYVATKNDSDHHDPITTTISATAASVPLSNCSLGSSQSEEDDDDDDDEDQSMLSSIESWHSDIVDQNSNDEYYTTLRMTTDWLQKRNLQNIVDDDDDNDVSSNHLSDGTTTTATASHTDTNQQQQQKQQQQNIAMIQHLLERWIQCWHNNNNNDTNSKTNDNAEVSLRCMYLLYQYWVHEQLLLMNSTTSSSNTSPTATRDTTTARDDYYKHTTARDSTRTNRQTDQHRNKERRATSVHINPNELLHCLYRLLHIYQQHSKKKQLQQQESYDPMKMSKKRTETTTTNTTTNDDVDDTNVGSSNKAYQLLQTYYHYYQQIVKKKNMSDDYYRPSPKAYSMVLETFSSKIKADMNNNTNVNDSDYFNSETSCSKSNSGKLVKEIITISDQLMEQLLHDMQQSKTTKTAASDLLVTQNAYLNVLAKCCSTFSSTRGKKPTQQQQQQLQIAEKAEYYLLHTMQQPNVKSYAAVLQGWVNCYSPQRACTLLHRMISLHIQQQQTRKRNNGDIHCPFPNLVCFNICLQALSNGGYATEAHELLLQMLQLSKHNSDVQPDEYSYLAVIKAYTKLSESTKVVEVFELMMKQQEQDQHHLRPLDNSNEKQSKTTTLYTTILHAMAQRPNSGPDVDKMLQFMEKQYKETGSMKPCREAYTIAIQAWGRTRNNIDAPEHATEIFHRMQNMSNVQQERNEKSKNDGEIGHHDTHLEHNDLTPCTITYTALLHAWAQSDRVDAPNHALEILHFMEKHQKRNKVAFPDTVTYNVVMSAFARHGFTHDAQQILFKMKVRMLHDRDNNSRKYAHAYPDVISWATLIQAHRISGLGRAGRRASALLIELENIYDKIRDVRLKPTHDVYSVSILAQNQDGEAAETIFQRILDRHKQSDEHNIFPNTSVCNALLSVWSKSYSAVAPQRAEAILKWMEDHKKRDTAAICAPNNESYQYLILTWNRSKRRNAQMYISKIMSKIRSLPLDV